MKIKKSKIDILSLILFILGLSYVIITIATLLWGVVSSFMPSRWFDNFPTKWPKEIVTDNYAKVWREFYVPVATKQKTYWIEDLFFNSLIYALGCATISAVTCSLTAYVAAQYNYKFSGVLCGIVIFAMSFPVIGTTVGELAILKFLRLHDTLIGVFILKINFLGMYFLVFYATFKGVPKSYAEAAKLDGAGHFAIMLKVYYPMAINAVLTVILLYFIQFWNDYQTPLLYLPSMPTASYALFLYNNRGGENAPFTTHKLASSMLVLVPTLVIFLVFQNRLIGKISLSGGVKG